MRTTRRTLVVVWALVASVVAPPVANARAIDNACSNVPGQGSVRAPTNAVAWRAGIQARAAVYYRLPDKRLHPSRWLARTDVPWLLILARPRAADNRCWLRVRLPWRPNDATGWVNANDVVLEKTRGVSRSRRPTAPSPCFGQEQPFVP
jgi:hypothetical protein